MNMVQKRRRVLCAMAHLKLTVSKWKSVLWSDESKFDILVGNYEYRVCDLPACYQHSVQNQHLWIALAFVSLIHFVSAADTTAELLYEQLICGLVVLVASNAIVK